MPNICISNLSHSYLVRKNEVKTLQNLNAHFDDKKINIIIGESGSGKTTILRCLMGFEDYSGEIKFDGADISKIAPQLRNIAYVSQNIALFPHMSIFNNIAYPLTIKHIDKNEIRKRVFALAKQFDIEDLLFRKPKELSLGQCQKVALAKAVIKRPTLYLLDEPFSNLDKDSAFALGTFFKESLKQISATVIFVTHDSKEALRLGDTISVLENGKIIFKGTPSEAYRSKDEVIKGYFLDE